MKKHAVLTRTSGPPRMMFPCQPSPIAGNNQESAARLHVVTALDAETSEPAVNVTPINLLPVRFGYFQPGAREVYLAGTFNNWEPRATPLQRDALGDWSIELQLPPGEYRYRLLVDGEWRDDPSARRTIANPFGGFDSVVEV